MRGPLATLAALLLLAPSAHPSEEVLLQRGLRTLRVLGAATAAQRGVQPGVAVVGTLSSELWITSGGKLYEVRRGLWVEPGGEGNLAGLTAFRGALHVTRGHLLSMAVEETLATVAELPHPDMRLWTRSDERGLLLYGGSVGPGTSVFALHRGMTYERLLEAPAPVTALAELEGELVYATGPDLFLVPSSGQPLKVYSAGEPILSIAVDAATGTLFFATPNAVYGLTRGQAVLLAAGVGGFLHHDGTNLLVLDSSRLQILAFQEPTAFLRGYREVTSVSPPVHAGALSPPPGVARTPPGLGFAR